MHLAPGLLALVLPEMTDSSVRSRDHRASRLKRSASVGPQSEGAGTASALRVYLTAVLGGAASACAWLVPGTGFSAVLGWIAVLLLVYTVRARRAYLPAFAAGLVGHLIGFYWVAGTVSAFGGFGSLTSALIFSLFVALGALLFLVYALVHHQLPAAFDALALRSATAIVIAELLTIRLFPWHFGHTQIAFTPFVQIAGIGGAMAVSFLMFWLAEVSVRIVVFRERRRTFLVPVILFAWAIGYGVAMMRTFSAPQGLPQEVIVVQGNASLAEKRDLDSARKNLDRIYALSCQAAHPGSLVVWPEGSVPAYIPAAIGKVGHPPVLPWIGDGTALLVGSYSFLPDQRRYNAAFAVYPDGTVPRPYFKQILIPFGESIPFSSYLPWLKGLNAKAGVFSAGTETRVFSYPMRRPDGTATTLKVAPLICYEDTVPALARNASRKGAELLINITSDSWFGRTLAPRQHHLIAAFRAIENRRFLIRATNTGLSGVVDPLGRTIASIPPFAEGTATAQVTPLTYRSAYAYGIGDGPWWALMVVAFGVTVHANGMWRVRLSRP
ncbi:apolipoprotein N-acyltransferase [Singulisphaera sp. Ch08]|uniref:Apolipoprotein N-acyltransferase n=1 Tax=Singulisphaera sp. Ch08 TaxID=3120278 RepID=A0AAU7CT30_9BACT